MKTTKEKQEKKKKLQQEVASLFGGMCSVCHKKRKVMQFQHTEYHKDEKTHGDFKNNLDCQLYVLPIVIDRPEEVEYLCRGEHRSVTRYRKTKQMRYKLERQIEIVRTT